MLDLRRLRLLRELETRGTLGAVAAALDYTPSAVSQQLAVLEREAGVKLLAPAGRGVVLTDAGRLLAAHADRLLAGVRAAEADLAAAAGTVRGTVRVAGLESACLHLIVPALARLATSHPDVVVAISEREVEEGVPALRLGALDVLVGDEYDGLPRPHVRGLHRELLTREQLRVVLPAAHPLAAGGGAVPLAALADEPWAVSFPSTGHHEMLLRTCRELGGFEPEVRHHSTDTTILLTLVREAGAVTFLPDLLGVEADPSVAVRPLAEGALHRELFTLTQEHAEARPAVAAVLAALIAVARGAPVGPPPRVGGRPPSARP